MCGPTTQEKQEAAQQQGYATTVQNNYKTLFGEQQGITDSLTNTFTPIALAGPNQTGFSAPELAAYNTQAINTTGANYSNAAKAVAGQLAGRGGSSGLESGIDAQIKAGLASNAAGELSREQLGITQANYAQGRENWARATGGLQALSGSLGVGSAGESGTNANAGAFSEAKTIEEQQAQADQAIGGMIAGGAMDAATFGAGAMGGGGLQGGLKALAGISG